MTDLQFHKAAYPKKMPDIELDEEEEFYLTPEDVADKIEQGYSEEALQRW